MKAGLASGWIKRIGIGLLLVIVAALLVLAFVSPHGPFNPTRRQAWTAIASGQEFLKQGQSRRALAAIADVPESGPWSTELLAVRGLARAALGQAESARQSLERSLKQDPRQTMVHKVLAAIYFSRGEDARGLAHLDQAVAIDPHDYRPWYAMGEAFLRTGDRDQAVRSFRRALELNGDHEESQIGLLKVLIETQPPEASSDLLHRLLSRRSNDPQVQILAASHARALGEAEQAWEHAETAVELAPGLAEARVLRANLLRARGKNAEALADVQYALDQDPNNLGALSLLAQLQAAAGEADRSRETIARHARVREDNEQIRRLIRRITDNPDDIEPRWKLGRLAADRGFRSLAVQSFQGALAIDANCQEALDGLRGLVQETTESSASEPSTPLMAPALVP